MITIVPIDSAPALVAIALAVGGLLGAVYFFLLYRTVRLQAGDGPVGLIVPLYLLRGGLAIAVFWGLAHFGALALLAGLAGFLAVRFLAQRLVREG
jgi:F1F0 ATPase subunit 2